MDPTTVQEQLAAADLARAAAESPRVPAALPPLIGAAVAVGFLALPLSPSAPAARFLVLAVALGCWAAAGRAVVVVCARRGVRGLRGRLRTTAVVLAVCALSLVPGALGTPTAMRVPYLVLAVGGGLAVWWVTRRRADGA